MYEEHYDNGYMRDRTPAPEDIYAFDEMGCDWMAKWPSTFNDDVSGINKALQRYWVATGDNHSPFWTTISFTSILTKEGEGGVLAPLVIHQGGTDGSMPASIAMYFKKEDNFMVHATKSGYQDGDGLNLVYGQIIEQRKQLGLSDMTGFVFGDGHDSHFNGPTMEYALSNKLQPFFLRSQNSTRDQVNDNGPNRRLKAIFATYLQKWISKYPGVAFNAQWFNLVFVEAWEEFATSPGLSACIKNAFEKTGTYPYITSASIFTATENESPSVKKYKAGVKAAYLIAAPLLAAADKSKADALVAQMDSKASAAIDTNGGILYSDDDDDEADNDEADNEEVVEVVTMTTTRMKKSEAAKIIGQGRPLSSTQQSVVIRKAALDIVNKVHVKPASEIAEMLAEQKKQRRIRVPKTAGNIPRAITTNPNTSSGLQMTQQVVQSALTVTAQRKQEVEEKKDRKDKTAALRQSKKTQASQDRLIVQLMHADDDDDWREMSVQQLWSAVHGFGGKKPAKGNKNDALSLLENYLVREGVTHSAGDGNDSSSSSSSSDSSSSDESYN